MQGFGMSPGQRRSSSPGQKIIRCCWGLANDASRLADRVPGFSSKHTPDEEVVNSFIVLVAKWAAFLMWEASSRQSIRGSHPILKGQPCKKSTAQGCMR